MVEFLPGRGEPEWPPLKEGHTQVLFQKCHLAAYSRLLNAIGNITHRLGDPTVTRNVVKQFQVMDVHGADSPTVGLSSRISANSGKQNRAQP